MTTQLHPQREIFTVVVRRPINKGDIAKIEAQIDELVATCEQFPGHLGGIVLRNKTGQMAERVIVLRFSDKTVWEAWREHPDTIGRIAALDDETGIKGERNFAEGIAGWFDLPGVTGLKAPPKWKMAVVTWISIFPLLLLVSILLQPITSGFGPFLRLAVGTVICVPIMTWIAMPMARRMLRRWLFKSA